MYELQPIQEKPSKRSPQGGAPQGKPPTARRKNSRGRFWPGFVAGIFAFVTLAALGLAMALVGYAAIARDLGRQLGCLGHVAHLRRIWSGPFDAADGFAFDRIDRANQAEIEAALLPIQSALADLPEMAATEIGATRILNGNPGQVLGHAEFGEEVWVSRNGRALCIGRYMGGEVQPARVFNLD